MLEAVSSATTTQVKTKQPKEKDAAKKAEPKTVLESGPQPFYSQDSIFETKSQKTNVLNQTSHLIVRLHTGTLESLTAPFEYIWVEVIFESNFKFKGLISPRLVSTILSTARPSLLATIPAQESIWCYGWCSSQRSWCEETFYFTSNGGVLRRLMAKSDEFPIQNGENLQPLEGLLSQPCSKSTFRLSLRSSSGLRKPRHEFEGNMF